MIPPISINAVEALWISVNGITAVLTVLALLDAWHDLRVANPDRRRARILAARGNVRRELFRTVVQFLLLSATVPGIFTPGEIQLSVPIACLIAVPIVLLLSSALDARDRNSLATMVLEDIATERAATALEASVQENIWLTREAITHADAAAAEANHVNVKIADLMTLIADLTRLVGGKEDKEPAAGA